MKLRHLIIWIIVLTWIPFVNAQYDGMKGQSSYQKYDKSYINPDTRGKHSVSLGVMASLTTPFDNDVVPSWAVHAGYNYLIIKKRKRIFGIKETVRDETNAGFGLHFTLMKESQFYVMANYYNPFFGVRGKLLSLYFFNEYGIGFHRFNDVELSTGKTAFNFSLEFLRVRFGKSPLYLHLTANYGVKNNLLAKERLDFGFLGGLRYYIFKKK
ncbi:MAG: hypothetical protein R2780_04400 [Crocinitomicaceae bacterium]